MITQVSSADRMIYVEGTILAMRGRLTEARELLAIAGEKARAECRNLDYTWLKMGLAEILYLDCREEESQAIFSKEINPVMAEVPSAAKVVVDLNSTTVGLANWDPESIKQFYRALDLQRVIGSDARSKRTMLFGESASRSARYFDSVPMFWRAVLEAHETSHWQSLYGAYKRLATECTKVGLIEPATYCAIRSLDPSIVGEVAELLSASRNAGIIAERLNSAVQCSHLLRHAAITSALVCRLADFVTEEQFDSLLRWTLERAMIHPWNRTSADTVQMIWKSLSEAAWRFDHLQARRVVESALLHPFATNVSQYRSVAISLLRACTSSMMAGDLRIVAGWGADILGAGRGTDVDDSLDLLTAVSTRADASLKSWLAQRLGLANYGRAPSDREAIFEALGFRPSNDDLSRLADEAVRQLSLQVQKGPFGSVPDTSLAFSLQSSFTSDKEAVTVFIPGGAGSFDSVTRYAKYLDRGTVEKLLRAALDQIGNPENALANRIFLLEDMRSLVPFLVEAEADAVVSLLKRVTTEVIVESPFVAADNNPLSPFQAKLGTPADVHARTVFLIAKVAARFPDRYTAAATEAIARALAGNENVVRTWALAGINELSVVSDDLVFGLLTCTRDPDLDVREAAFGVLASHKTLRLDALHKRFLIFSIRQSMALSPTPLRWIAARSVWAQVLQEIPDDLRSIWENTRELIRVDPSRAVRAIAAGPLEEQISLESITRLETGKEVREPVQRVGENAGQDV